MIQIRPIVDAVMFQQAKDLAQEDGDGVVHTSHVIIKDGEVVGAFSVTLPALSWWLHTGCTPRASLAAFQGMDTILAERGGSLALVPCERRSPYYKLLEREDLGFGKLPGEWDLFLMKS